MRFTDKETEAEKGNMSVGLQLMQELVLETGPNSSIPALPTSASRPWDHQISLPPHLVGLGQYLTYLVAEIHKLMEEIF